MKKVLITGTSRGIGFATANKFLDEGWFVLGASTKEGIIKNPNYRHYVLDLGNQESIDLCISLIKKDETQIDALINCAGVYFEPDNPELNVSSLRKNLEVNLIGTAHLTENILPIINPDHGKIIIISSMMSSLVEFDKGDFPAYRISITALNMYAKTLADRLKTITVSVFDPGWVKTDMGGPDATRDPSIPAQELFDLANKPHETGKFWFEGKIRSW